MSEDRVALILERVERQVRPWPEFADALLEQCLAELEGSTVVLPRRRWPSPSPRARKIAIIAAALGLALIAIALAVSALRNLDRPETPADIGPFGEPPPFRATVSIDVPDSGPKFAGVAGHSKMELSYRDPTAWRLAVLAGKPPGVIPAAAGSFGVWDGDKLRIYNSVDSTHYSQNVSPPHATFSPLNLLAWDGPEPGGWSEDCAQGTLGPNDSIAGRTAFHVMCPASGVFGARADVWVDAETGLVLKITSEASDAAQFAFRSPIGLFPGESLEITKIEYSPAFAPDEFAFAPPSTSQSPAASVPPPAPLGVTATVDVGPRPAPVDVGFGSVWVGTLGDDSVSRIDPATNRVIATIHDVGASGLAVGAGSVWVTKELTSSMSQVDPATNEVIATIDVGKGAHGVAVGFGSVWVANLNGSVLRVDPATNEIVATIPVDCAQRVAVGDGTVWAAGCDSVARIDPATNNVVAEIPVPGPGDITVDATGVWVTRFDDSGAVARIDPQTNAPVAAIHVGTEPNYVRVVDGLVWVAVEGENFVTRIDPATEEAIDRIDVGQHPAGMAFDGAAAWVTNNADGTVSRIDL